MTLEKIYLDLKEAFYKIEDLETIKKYRLLHKAKLIGFKIYGKNYTIKQLAKDFEIPFTTVKRCLALEKANDRTWQLIKSKKISAFKIAMVLMTKDNYYQDEVVDMVLKNNLSTYQIKQIRVKNYKDIAKNNTKFAILKGYSRQHEAYYKFIQTIDRLNLFLDINQKVLSENNIKTIKLKLEKLKDNIDKKWS